MGSGRPKRSLKVPLKFGDDRYGWLASSIEICRLYELNTASSNIMRILRVVSSTIARSVLWINTVEGVWKDLKKRFNQHDVFRIVEIQS
nr:uncharacterized protein LOC109168022 [Ipomoea batatas]